MRRGASQHGSFQQAATARERSQSQPAPTGVRCTRGPAFSWHCHCRGTQRRPRLIWRPSTQLPAAPISRSRAFWPMLLPSARELGPFFVQPHALPGLQGRAGACQPPRRQIICLFKMALIFIYCSLARAAGFLPPALGPAVGDSRARSPADVCSNLAAGILICESPFPFAVFYYQ